MRIEVHIEEQLEDLWSQIGLSQEEIEDKYEDLVKKVEMLFQNYLKDTYDSVETMKTIAEKMESEIKLKMSQFELGKNYGISPNAPLNQRIKVAELRLKNINEATSDQKDKHDRFFKELCDCFDILEIDDRGDFSSEGNNFGSARIKSICNMISDLKTKIYNNTQIVENL